MISPIAPTDLTAWISAQNVAAPVVTSGIADPLGGTGAFQIVFPAVGAGQYSFIRSPNIPLTATAPFVTAQNERDVFTVWLRCAAGPVDVNLWVDPLVTTFGLTNRVTVTSTWQKFSVFAQCVQAERRPSIGTNLGLAGAPIPGQAATSAATIEAWLPRVLPVTPSLTTGLVSDWEFDGSVVDATGANTGIATGITYLSGQIGSGQAGFFTGATALVTTANPAPFRSTDFTFAAWIRTTASSSVIASSWKPYPIYGGWMLIVDGGSGGKLLAIVGNASGGVVTMGPSASPINDGNWHHVVFLSSASLAFQQLHVDGVLQAQTGGVGPVYGTATQFGIGANVLWDGVTSGEHDRGWWDAAGVSIDQANYWNRVLSWQEIEALFASGAGIAYPFATSGTVPGIVTPGWVPGTLTPVPVATGVTLYGRESYLAQLKALLPPGRVFNLEPDSVLSRVLEGVADELTRVNARGADLINESDPRTAVETLSDWEATVGLPDARVTAIPSTTAGRQVAITQKYTTREGQNRAFFDQLCAACGYPLISIDTFSGSVLRAGFRVGDRCFDRVYGYTVRFNVAAATAGALSHADFERVIRHATHSHITAIFTYA
jgi:uncharacterized protein YmfQ (DUF2313 family)